MLINLIKLSGILFIAITFFSYAEKFCKTQELDTISHVSLITHITKLASDEFSGRKFASKESALSQHYISNVLRTLKVPPFKTKYLHCFQHDMLFSKKNGCNIIGYIKGKRLPSQYIVLTAHFDHLGRKSSSVFNGADDNASGVSALLVFAEKLIKDPLNYSVILLFTDGEEVNLLGAKAFAKQQSEILANVILNINVDMIAGAKSTTTLHYIQKGLFSIINANNFTELVAKSSLIKVKQGFHSYNQSTLNRRQWYEASDHSVFFHHTIPFIYYGVGNHKNYHTKNDTINNINKAFFINASQLIYDHLRYIDNHIQVKIKT